MSQWNRCQQNVDQRPTAQKMDKDVIDSHDLGH